MVVQNSEWGPPLWRILHTLAGRLGGHAVPFIQKDEARCWMLLLRAVEDAMPCQLCRSHYKRWRAAHPIEDFMPMGGLALRLAAQRWLWALHDEVNRERGAAALTFEEAEALYAGRGNADLAADTEKVGALLKEAIMYRQSKAESVSRFRSALNIMRKYC